MYLGPSSSQGEFCSQGVRREPHRGLHPLHVPDGSELLRQPRGEGGARHLPCSCCSPRLCLDYEADTISYILTLTDEQFLVQVNC